MTTPTQAQIEAAAKAIYDLPVNWRANKPLWQNARYQYIDEAKAALTAAADVGPDPSGFELIEQLGRERDVRAATIERCAQVAEHWDHKGDPTRVPYIAVAAEIRALKDKP